jgi:hypothetical protein
VALRSELAAVLDLLPTALGEPYAQHPLARRIRGVLADEVRSIVSDESYKTEGSAGAGRWAETVWLLSPISSS